jgi:ribose/xylose/arabinose/galactoside ABC-type transport system permease subunit
VSQAAPEDRPPTGGPLAAPINSAVSSFSALGGLGVGLVVFLVVEVTFFAIRSPFFLDANNWKNIGRAIAIIGIVAVGETLVIISGGFDLSVGSVMAAAGMMSGYLVQTHGWDLGLAFVPALLLGAVVGLANGAIISYARINALIATLATLAIVRGLSYVTSGGKEIPISDSDYLSIGTSSVAGVPVTVVILLVAFAAVGLAMPRTRFGRYAYAIGSSARAAKLAGVDVNRWRLAFYVTCGLLAAVGGLVTVARTGNAQPSANLGIELDVITAVILGGTSLTGGRGRLFGTFLGLLVIGVLNNGLVLINVQSYWQQVIKGFILLAAVSYDELRRTRRDED